MLTKTIKISFIVSLALLLFSTAYAADTVDGIVAEDSMYRYNALESNASLSDLIDGINNGEDQSTNNPTSNTTLPDDTTKKLQDITEEQNFSTQQVEDAMTALQNRSEVTTFLVGNDLGTLKFQLVQLENQSYVLNQLSQQNIDSTTYNQIMSQLMTLNQERTKVENFIVSEQNKFSLFGWFVKII